MSWRGLSPAAAARDFESSTQAAFERRVLPVASAGLERSIDNKCLASSSGPGGAFQGGGRDGSDRTSAARMSAALSAGPEEEAASSTSGAEASPTWRGSGVAVRRPRSKWGLRCTYTNQGASDHMAASSAEEETFVSISQLGTRFPVEVSQALALNGGETSLRSKENKKKTREASRLGEPRATARKRDLVALSFFPSA